MASSQSRFNNDLNSVFMDDVTATRLGLKIYTNALSGNNSWSDNDVNLIPYQMQDGSWRLRFSVTGNTSSTLSVVVTFPAGTTFKDVPSGHQHAAYASRNSSLTINHVTALAVEAGSDIELGAATAGTKWQFAGDLPLESKPSWAA